MAWRKKPKNNEAEQLERLNSEVRTDGVGEDEAVRKLVTDFPTMSNVDAAQVSLALHNLVRGVNSIQQTVGNQGELIDKMMKRMEQMDKAAEKWELDRQKFLEDVQTRADSMLLSEQKRIELMQREGKRVQNQVDHMRANTHVDNLAFQTKLEQGPKEIVTSHGIVKTINDAGVIRQVVFPEEIQIRNVKIVLQPGVPTEVPAVFAQELRSRQKTRQALDARKALLNADKIKSTEEVSKGWKQINDKFGTNTEVFGG